MGQKFNPSLFFHRFTAAPLIEEAAMATKHQVSIPQPPHHREVITLLLYYGFFLFVHGWFDCWLKYVILPSFMRLEMWVSVQTVLFPQIEASLLIGIVSLNGVSSFVFFTAFDQVESYFLDNFFCFILLWICLFDIACFLFMGDLTVDYNLYFCFYILFHAIGDVDFCSNCPISSIWSFSFNWDHFL